jgi:cellulose synthase/poly-beta-1,6-N-acetylglucosamine synthase-like glycosyltransferase
MLFTLITAISLFFSLAYLLLMLRYSFDWNGLETFQASGREYDIKVSVIVIARNEADNIEACLKSIAEQTYTKELVEILLVDDQSTDKTVEMAANLSIKQLKILQNNSLNGKKQLLSFAISVSEAELIICTDADCQVPKGWINQIVALYVEQDAKFIAAPVQFTYNKMLFQKFQALDFLGMMAITGAGIKGKYLYMCNGANLAYPKAVFQEMGGFEGIDKKASGDDMLLMQKIALRYPNKIYFLKNREAVILTKPAYTLSEFWQQRLRWASKSGDYPQKLATIQLALVWLFIFTLPVTFIFSFFEPRLFLVLSFSILLKIIADYVLLNAASTYFNKKNLLTIFLPAVFLHCAYILTVGFMAIFKRKYHWKDRKLS